VQLGMVPETHLPEVSRCGPGALERQPGRESAACAVWQVGRGRSPLLRARCTALVGVGVFVGGLVFALDTSFAFDEIWE